MSVPEEVYLGELAAMERNYQFGIQVRPRAVVHAVAAAIAACVDRHGVLERKAGSGVEVKEKAA